MPDASSSIGTRKDLPVRFGNSMQPQFLKLSVKSGKLDLDAGRLVTGILLKEADESPLADLNFVVTQMQAPTAGERWWRLDLGMAAVRDLATRVGTRTPTSAGRAAANTRTAYWTASFEDATGRRPLAYGRLTITLGAAGA